MNQQQTYRATPQVIVGILIIAVGVLFILDRMEVLYARDYLRYWPVILIVFGVSRFLQPGNQGKLFGGVVAIIGTLLLLDKLDVLEFRVWDLWPLILVFIGGSVLWRALQRQNTVTGPGNREPSLHGFAFWSGIDRKCDTQDFQGGELTAIMGGCEIDLRNAAIKNGEAVLDVFAFWGGIELKVPEHWRVVLDANPIMGGIEDKSRTPDATNAPRLVIRGTLIMGGMEIRN